MAIFEEYIPAPLPLDIPPALRQYLDDELQRISSALNVSTIHLDPLATAPPKPSNGVIAYADGTNWNPGSGEGFYGYQAGAWVKL